MRRPNDCCPFPDKKCKECPFYQLRYAFNEDGTRATEAGKGAQYYECVWVAEIKLALRKMYKSQSVSR